MEHINHAIITQPIS